jgi:hypothetical protein
VLHVGLATYTDQNGEWPQAPSAAGDESEFWEWWVTELENYGVLKKIWFCPSETKAREIEASPDEYIVSYIPTHFESGARTPFKYPGQPWAIERGAPHSEGAHMLMPDGSIKVYVNQQQTGVGPK